MIFRIYLSVVHVEMQMYGGSFYWTFNARINKQGPTYFYLAEDKPDRCQFSNVSKHQIAYVFEIDTVHLSPDIAARFSLPQVPDCTPFFKTRFLHSKQQKKSLHESMIVNLGANLVLLKAKRMMIDLLTDKHLGSHTEQAFGQSSEPYHHFDKTIRNGASCIPLSILITSLHVNI